MNPRSRHIVIVGAALVAIGVAGPYAREMREVPAPTIERRAPVSLDQELADDALFFSAATADTTWLGMWDFDGAGMCDAQNWQSVDLWNQLDTYFHVDDFAGLAGGDYGGLVPLEGSQSLWCGVRPDGGVPLCGYAALPGYGNMWEQTFTTTACLSVTGDVSLSALASWDTEPGYDYVFVEYSECDGVWNELERHDGVGNTGLSATVPAASHSGSVRLRVRVSTDPSYSDEDGLWNSDGAVVVDQLAVSDGGGSVLPAELFEAEAVGDTATVSGNWIGGRVPGYGDYASPVDAVLQVQEDFCRTNATCVWSFFEGSTFDYSCGTPPFPGQPAVPFVNARGQSLQNEVWSPVLPLTGSGTQVVLAFDVYRDLDFSNLVFYRWRVRSWTAGCPGPWRQRASVYYGANKDWFRSVAEIGDLIEPGADAVQVSLGARDMCFAWCGTTYPFPTCHSHAPMFDNVEIYRVATQGPRWSVRAIDLFQDTFAEDGTLTGTARADVANDRLPALNPSVRPGDSVTVTVNDFVNGIAADPITGSGPAVYAWVSVSPQGQPGKAGAELVDDAARWPVVDSTVVNGDTWYQIRMDTSFTGAGRTGPVPEQYCLDLRDDLFVPGDVVSFIFGATSDGGGGTSYWSEFTGATGSMQAAVEKPMEFSVLPVNGLLPDGDVLYVDGFDGFGAEEYVEGAFDASAVANVDRFDVRGPDALVGNRPGTRVKNVLQQLVGVYRVIVWNTGDLEQGLIGDGSGSPEKADDAALLHAFLDNLPESGGVYFTGDNIASELETLGSPSAGDLRSWITYSVTSSNHLLGGIGGNTATFVVGQPGSAFDHVSAPDSFWVDGACPVRGQFDVIEATGSATLQMAYGNVDYGFGTGGAAVAQQTTNSQGMTASVMLEGFSFERISNNRAYGYMDRWEHMHDVITYMGVPLPIPSSADAPHATSSLAQNYPNPFNPTTTIEFALRERGRVQLRVYNVAGQLVRTLVDDVRAGGVVNAVEWDGRSDAGREVASGVYFYRLVAPGFVQTRKMVMLK